MGAEDTGGGGGRDSEGGTDPSEDCTDHSRPPVPPRKRPLTPPPAYSPTDHSHSSDKV